MITTVALLAYAGALALWGERLTRRLSWLDRAPRLGLVIWQTASLSVLAGVVLAGLTSVVPVLGASRDLADLLDACQMMLLSHYGAPGRPAEAYAGLVVALGVTLWTVAHIAVALVRTGRERRGHARMLAVLARRHPGLDALVLEHDQPLAYCLPGRHRCVVLTTGVLARLDEAQVAAVLAHERAHLAGRHDLAVNLAAALGRAFPGVPLFRAAREEIGKLVELRADDVAAGRHDRLTVAAALVAVASGRAPSAALGAGGPAALLRVRRMLAPHQPLPLRSRLVGLSGAGLLAVLPLILATNPLITALLERHCHFLH